MARRRRLSLTVLAFKNIDMENWLRTDEHEEAVSALEMFSESLPPVLGIIYRWKWSIISLHNAVQGFMVLSLRQGNGLLALKDHIAAKWLKAYRAEEPLPEEKLEEKRGHFPVFFKLYRKLGSVPSFLGGIKPSRC